MQCDISLHCACKLAFKSPSLAYPCVYFSCSSNALTLTSVPLTFPSSRDKARNAKYIAQTQCGGHSYSSFLCHRTALVLYISRFFQCLTSGSWCSVGEALQQEKVTSSPGDQSPGEISVFSFSLLDKSRRNLKA